jgi:uncharacterized protein with NRDE domain
MCLIAIAVHASPRYRVVIAANRDEFCVVPAAPWTFGTMIQTSSAAATCAPAEAGWQSHATAASPR